MTDVLKIAIERRAKLQDEVAKLDDFIRMAETLMSTPQEAASPAPMATPAPSTPAAASLTESMVRTATRRAMEAETPENDVPRPSIIRRSANAAG